MPDDVTLPENNHVVSGTAILALGTRTGGTKLRRVQCRLLGLDNPFAHRLWRLMVQFTAQGARFTLSYLEQQSELTWFGMQVETEFTIPAQVRSGWHVAVA